MLGALVLLSCLACDLASPAADRPAASAVDVELVLAVDVSQSMDRDESALQRAGYLQALRDPAFIAAVRSGVNGRIAIAYFEWAGTIREESVVAWQLVDSLESAAAFAARIERRPYAGLRGTSISGALAFGAALFDGNAFDGPRRVIDISGDGPNNTGLPVADVRDRAVANGLVINGLPILIRPSPTFSHLDRYYAECVIGGPGSFVLPIYQASEFATAIRRKLILEVSGVAPEPRIVPAANPEPIDCLQGERDRRLYADPYFPELDR
jgi:hypothetical protein